MSIADLEAELAEWQTAKAAVRAKIATGQPITRYRMENNREIYRESPVRLLAAINEEIDRLQAEIDNARGPVKSLGRFRRRP